MREYHLRGMNPAEVRTLEESEGEALIILSRIEPKEQNKDRNK